MIKQVWHSFPIQLLVLHLQKNLALIIIWGILLGFIVQDLGVTLGIPFLFLDPEYLHEVSWLSFMLMGIGAAILTMAFHMTTYIMDGRRFSFLAILDRPFIHFCVNNSIIPLIFFLVYILSFVSFQMKNDLENPWEVIHFFLAFSAGSAGMFGLIFGYFALTNKGFFVLFAGNLDKRLRKVRLTRSRAISQYKELKNQNRQVDVYLDLKLRPVAVRGDISRFEAAKLLKVFNQNHLNLFFIQLFLISLVLILGFFKELPVLQLPAAMSVMILVSILVMVVGAVSFWLKNWTTLAIIGFLVVVNYFSNFDFLNRPHEAFGMDYEREPAEYTLARLDALLHEDTIRKDRAQFEEILNNWRSKFTDSVPPKLFIVTASGGGQRAALWTLHVLQNIYRIDSGSLIKNVELMTGASGGVLGEALFREIYLQSLEDSKIDPGSTVYLDQLSADNLNPIIFTLLVNDLLIRNQYFEYNGRKYLKDRGFAFEKQLNENTLGVLNKPLSAYRDPEASGQIPLLPVTSLITNDGRKLVISPHSMSFLGASMLGLTGINEKPQSVDFTRFFADHDAMDLRFLTALRMSATFPFITPNIELPSEPSMETMDTGLSDNFGIQDALRFIYVFQSWIAQNTSGVVLVTIRDSEKSSEIPATDPPKILNKLFTPLRNIYSNWDNVQTIQNEVLHNYMNESMPFEIEKVEFEYSLEEMQEDDLTESQENLQRASLNWRLTAREKRSILENIKTKKNQAALKRLEELAVEIKK
ncbi:patatin-like phospholipase family protein [Algoriphagus namhaensis]|uniref:Patatin-like phospholipase family protein n=1 Tax=Algoriphagus namhaensis TaxID=915353 RepID=A0ABV8AUG6_9BACT